MYYVFILGGIFLNFFSREMLNIHKLKQQKLFQKKFFKKDVFKKDNNGFYTFEDLHVSLANCTCDYFVKNQLPCEHIYGLAKQLKVFKMKIKLYRSENFIAKFDDGYITDWAFPLPDFFKSALDIKWTDRVIKKKKFTLLTQGKYYEFFQGQLFYNNKIAYTKTWGEAFPHLDCIIKVAKSTENKVFTRFIIRNNVLYRYPKILYGNITFQIYKPDIKSLKIILVEEKTYPARRFLNFLKYGR